ncbi:MAG: DUF72 domain-containing protein, partial [Thermoleophilia bacterium]
MAVRHGKGRFHPARLPQRAWLEHHAGRFATVEVSATFDRLPAPSTAEAWAGRVPEGGSARPGCPGRARRPAADGQNAPTDDDRALARFRGDAMARAGARDLAALAASPA